MNILGIDQSFTSTGIYLESDGKIHHTVIGTIPNKDDPLEKFKRASLISETVADLVGEYKITHFTIEGLAFGNIAGNATRDLSGLQYAIINKVLERYPHVEVSVITPTTLKKFATGGGRAKKQDMLESVPEAAKEDLTANYKKSKGLYDVVDAYWLFRYTLNSQSEEI